MDEERKWDEAAVDYQRTYKLGQNDYNTAIIDFWEQNGMLYPGCRFLDVGCGVGKYGVMLAKRGYDVTLTDISGEMLRHASENLAPYSTPWRVYQCDFNEATGQEPVFEGGFDFSISTMSPAIHDIDTVRKLSVMTRRCCFITRFSSWSQPARDQLQRLLNLEPKPVMSGLREDCAGIIQAVSAAGYVPNVKYVEYNWSDSRTPEETADYMLRNYFADSDIKPDRKVIEAAARELCDESGMFIDAVNTKVAWIYWNTNTDKEKV